MRCALRCCRCERQSPVNNAVDGVWGLSAVKAIMSLVRSLAIPVHEGAWRASRRRLTHYKIPHCGRRTE
jgi:hypothetical protein